MTGSATLPTVGLSVRRVQDIKATLDLLHNAGYGYLCTHMVHSEKVKEQLYQPNFVLAPTKPFSWSDLAVPPSDWRRGVVGIISDVYTFLNDEENESMRQAAIAILNQQVNYCQHLSLPAIIIELPLKEDFANMANFLNERLNSVLKAPNSYWIKVQMTSNDSGNGDDGDALGKDPWNVWNSFRSLCEFDRHVFPVLELQADAPTQEQVDRWIGEPVKALFISTSVFLTNAEGFPVLSKTHQRIVKQFFKLKVQVVIETEEVKNLLVYTNQFLKYIQNLASTLEPDGVETFAAGYEDVIQIPLQPLRDHLESGTYEVFEKDPVKYVLYEDAVYRAIMTKMQNQSDPKFTLIVMVVGAGRGPLVFRSLAAACRAKQNIHVYAVEKNVNAVNTLLHLKNEFWRDNVTVVSADMRDFNPPVKADIIVSELLGSLGDNELSPECLDGAQRFLKPDGIMIPTKYSSFVAPCMSIKYYQDVAFTAENVKHKFANFETPYIIHMNNKYIIAPPQKLFTFEHPNYESEKSNDRMTSRKFVASQDCVLTGFSGYFESVLFSDILMSILPSTHSRGMFSWFPLFLPLRQPVDVKKGETIVAHFWRKSSKSGVWYEWTITSPVTMGIHNANGRSGSGVMQL